MPTKKIREVSQVISCNHSEHNIPTHQVFSPWEWEHTCPACWNKKIFFINSTWTMENKINQ